MGYNFRRGQSPHDQSLHDRRQRLPVLRLKHRGERERERVFRQRSSFVHRICASRRHHRRLHKPASHLCVCVRERERERKRECVCVCVRERESARARRARRDPCNAGLDAAAPVPRLTSLPLSHSPSLQCYLSLNIRDGRNPVRHHHCRLSTVGGERERARARERERERKRESERERGERGCECVQLVY